MRRIKFFREYQSLEMVMPFTFLHQDNSSLSDVVRKSIDPRAQSDGDHSHGLALNEPVRGVYSVLLFYGIISSEYYQDKG